MTLGSGKNKARPTATRVGALRRAVEIYREEGLYALWIKFLGEFVYRRLLYLERPLAEPLTEVAASLSLHIDRLHPNEIDAYLAFHDEDPREQIEHRFSLGEICFVARADGDIVCANWACEGKVISEHWIRYVRHALPIAEDEVYLYDSYTSPDYRGLRIAPCLAVWVLDYYRKRGYRRTTTAIVPENHANLRARAKSGFRVCGSLGYIRTGFRLRHFHRDASKSPLEAEAKDSVPQ